ncbi:hypothetical protein LSAT2_017040 [Lamellibrachia satsuma]|nr:hypothetical protein LSAT2_017040 [Lamellibrachia satsuma]
MTHHMTCQTKTPLFHDGGDPWGGAVQFLHIRKELAVVTRGSYTGKFQHEGIHHDIPRRNGLAGTIMFRCQSSFCSSMPDVQSCLLAKFHEMHKSL